MRRRRMGRFLQRLFRSESFRLMREKMVLWCPKDWQENCIKRRIAQGMCLFVTFEWEELLGLYHL